MPVFRLFCLFFKHDFYLLTWLLALVFYNSVANGGGVGGGTCFFVCCGGGGDSGFGEALVDVVVVLSAVVRVAVVILEGVLYLNVY